MDFGSDETGDLGDGSGVLAVDGVGVGDEAGETSDLGDGTGGVVGDGAGFVRGKGAGLIDGGNGDGVGGFVGGGTGILGDGFGDSAALINKIMSMRWFYQVKCLNYTNTQSR